MQMLLPIFPVSTEYITPMLGVCREDEIITYIHCGVPIYSHAEDDIKGFRFITSKFVLQGLCKKIEISRCFHVSYDSVKRYVKKLERLGTEGFFSEDNRGGSRHKLLPPVLAQMQKYLDAGKSNSEIARLEGVTEGAIRYALKTGALKKNVTSSPLAGSNRTERSIQDSQSSRGIATSRETDRFSASIGLLDEAAPLFEHANNVCNGGVLFLVPSLISQGLLKAEDIYTKLKKGYYGLVSTLLTLAFMFLSRIKCPEQLKTCKVGEFGRLLGLDRVPEAKCLRSKIGEIVTQSKAEAFNHVLSQEWMAKESPSFLYVDGHVRVYHGYKANLTKRYVSREKLCLAGTTEFWINNELGMPYLVVFSELNEKLKDVILTRIIPMLLTTTVSNRSEEELEKNKNLARFTLVFDREGYDIPFFKKLWIQHRIAVLTYRKSVQDTWKESDFNNYETIVIGKTVSMKLCEKVWEKEAFNFREIRRLSENGHQTSIVTTHPTIATEIVAGKMFSRWSQENFFRYMVQDYDLDKMLEYGLEEVNQETMVVNPSYNTIEYQLKKLREKSARLKAKLYATVEKNLDSDIDTLKQQLYKQAKVQDAISNFENEISCLCEKKSKTPRYIKLKDMPEQKRYNKLKTESKLFMNTIRMIAYRAETSIANLLAPHYSKAEVEIRMVVKEIIKSDADLIPDYDKQTLTVRLHTLSTPRANRAALKLCEILNDTETLYPGTNLKLVYEMV